MSSNYAINFRKLGYWLRPSRIINSFRLGFDNQFVKTHFNLPFEVIGITEAQRQAFNLHILMKDLVVVISKKLMNKNADLEMPLHTL